MFVHCSGIYRSSISIMTWMGPLQEHKAIFVSVPEALSAKNSSKAANCAGYIFRHFCSITESSLIALSVMVRVKFYKYNTKDYVGQKAVKTTCCMWKGQHLFNWRKSSSNGSLFSHMHSLGGCRFFLLLLLLICKG